MVRLSVHNNLNKTLQFLYNFPREVFGCQDEVVKAEEIVAAEDFNERIEEILQALLSQVLWSFWQSDERFPSESLRASIRRVLGR
jgi:hypothetical protein